MVLAPADWSRAARREVDSNPTSVEIQMESFSGSERHPPREYRPAEPAARRVWGWQCRPGTCRPPVGVGLDRPSGVRNQPAALSERAEWRAADASDADAAIEAASGAAVIYQCLNAPYPKWAELFPPLRRGVLAAAERHGALLVSLENLYGYGPTAGAPMTEDLPLVASTVKGRTRAAMTRELLEARDAGRVHLAIGRASDFFGAGVTEGSTLGDRVFGNAVSGRRADFIGNQRCLTLTATFRTSPGAWPPWAPTRGQ